MQEKNTPEKFWAKVSKQENGCWLYTGTVLSCGYGQIKWQDGTPMYAHRLSWLLTYGSLPDKSLVLRHKCDNHRCVNPEHLIVGTQKQNVKDYWDKNRPPHAFKGVSYVVSKGKWRAYYHLNSRLISLGMHLTQILALEARNKFLSENPHLAKD